MQAVGQVSQAITRTYLKVQRAKVPNARFQDLKKHDNKEVQRDPGDHRGKTIDVLA